MHSKKAGNSSEDFDVIVIGSGMGGLTAAAILSKLEHKKVLVLEKHFTVGGLTHEFARGKYTWDVGLHYVGELAKSEYGLGLFDYITDGKLKWAKMPPVFEKFVYPDGTFDVPDNPAAYEKKLFTEFPDEQPAIAGYFKDIKRAAAWSKGYMVAKAFPAFIGWMITMINRKGKGIADITVKEYVDRKFKSQTLKSLLASQWGDYGLPPGKASFAIHALIVNTYLNGGYYPIGGAASIAKNVQSVIERSGGLVLADQQVTSLIIEEGMLKGVRVNCPDGQNRTSVSYYAPVVISAIGIVDTYNKFLKGVSPIPNEIDQGLLPKGLSIATVYIGLNKSAETLGIKGENYWIYNSYDHDQTAAAYQDLLTGNPKFCYLSFPSLKNPESWSNTAEIIAFIDYDCFKAFAGEPWLSKEKTYYDLKDKIMAGLIDFVEKSIPGFKNLVDYAELSTPLSIENFTQRSRGEMYGLAQTTARYKLPWLVPKTSLRNFFIAGSDIGSLGISGAMMGGVACASIVSGGMNFIKLQIAIRKEQSKRTGKDKLLKDRTSEPPRAMPGQTMAVLVDRQKITDNFYELTFEMDREVSFSPGQHMYLQVGFADWRPYSIVKINKNRVVFAIDVNPGGNGAKFVLRAVLGQQALLRLPSGTLKLEENDFYPVFVATGSGVTPFFPLIRQLADKALHKPTKILLLWGVIDDRGDFSKRYLKDLPASIDLKTVLCTSRPSRRSDVFAGTVTEKLPTLGLDYKNCSFYLCGNPGMVTDVHKLLRAKGATCIHFEL